MSVFNYKIDSRSDFMTGTFLITRIPEEHLDQNALYTIQADCPEFILPFRYKSVNGEIEFVYKVGTKSKLKYFSGELDADEYIKLWQSLINPLLECGDWFMNPCAFVLDTEHLYYEKNNKTVSYVYIPTTHGNSGNEAFKDMAIEISKLMIVSDAELENKVLRFILNDFNPYDFLKMLKEHNSLSKKILNQAPLREEHKTPEALIISDTNAQEPNFGVQEDIVINIHMEEGERLEASGNKKERESGGYRVFSSKSRRKKELRKSEAKAEIISEEPKNEPLRQLTKPVTSQLEKPDITQETKIDIRGVGLRYIGNAHLPQAIEISISEGETFSIGRFDATVGKRLSDFEFDKKTRAVSRRHAVIERSIEGYKIIDLSSSAGTFLDNRRLPPNTPFGLKAGNRISFGNSGADYVWQAG
jgi:pSer/pThr/pTyr-binding forkhead associated (FHA) protein